MLSFSRLFAQHAFEAEIKAFEKKDSLNAPASGQILLYGSSTIRLWRTFQEDFKGYAVLNRGFGGSQTPDALYYFDRMVLKYRPRLIFLYEGDNDLAQSKKSPKEVLADIKMFVKRVRKELPGTAIALYSVKPSPIRDSLLTNQKETNRRFKKLAKSYHKGVYYVDTFTPMLNENGKPKPELFIGDRLHMNEKGYVIWTQVTREFLSKNFGNLSVK